MLDMLIQGGRVVTPAGVGDWDVGIEGEKIVADCLLTGEPFFVFRGRDIFTPMVIKRYIQQLEEVGPDDPDMQASVVDFLAMLRKWQAANITKVRYPD